MGSILVSVPDISDSELIYSEEESKQILKFFWPSLIADVDQITINNDARRLAQTALIAAIDGSNAMGFVDALFSSITRRNKNIASLAKRLAQNFTRQLWKNSQRQDLENAKIYESVRASVARALKWRIEMIRSGLALKRGPMMFYAQNNPKAGIWA